MGLLPVQKGDYQDIAKHGGSLSTAVSSIGSSTPTTLLINEDITISSSVTVTSNITLKVPQGITITINSGQVLTLSGELEAGKYPIFSSATSSGNQSVIFDHPATSYPEWHNDADETDKLQRAQVMLDAGGEIILSKIYQVDGTDLGTYRTGVSLLNDNITFRGLDKNTCGIKSSTSEAGICVYQASGTTRSNLRFTNMKFVNGSPGSGSPSNFNGAGISLAQYLDLQVDNCVFTNWDAFGAKVASSSSFVSKRAKFHDNLFYGDSVTSAGGVVAEIDSIPP